MTWTSGSGDVIKLLFFFSFFSSGGNFDQWIGTICATLEEVL